MSKFFSTIREDFRLIPIGVKLVVSVIFLRSLGWGFADPFYSIYLHQFINDYTVVGLFAGLMNLSALITIIPLMRLSEKIKEKTIIQDGELLYFFVLISFVMSGIFKSIPLLIISILFAGIAQTFVVIGTETYIRKYGAPGKTRPFALYIAMDYSGWILGMFIASFTVQHYSLNSMFLFIIPSVIASFFILPRIHEKGLSSIIAGFKRYLHTGKDFINIMKDFKEVNSKMIFFLVLAFFDAVVYMFSYIFIPLLGLSINMSLNSIALLMAAMYFPFILSFFFTELFEKFRMMNLIAIALFVGAASFITLYFVADKYGIVLIASVISLSMAIMRPIYNGALTRLSPRGMFGHITGLNNFVQKIGKILGPVITGLVADVYGLPTTFIIIGIIALGLGIISITLRSYDRLISPKFVSTDFPVAEAV